MADRALSGWAYWEYNSDAFGFLRADGTEKPKAAALVRTYPRAVAGTRSTSATTLLRTSSRSRFDGDGRARPTEIYIPAARHYPHGFEIHVSDPDGAWTSAWDADREVLSLWTDPGRISTWCRFRPGARR